MNTAQQPAELTAKREASLLRMVEARRAKGMTGLEAMDEMQEAGKMTDAEQLAIEVKLGYWEDEDES